MAVKTKKKPVHIHSFERIRGETNTYKCTHPTCMYTNTKGRLEGKLALCAYCPTTFKLTADSLRLKKPHCPNCHPDNNFKKYRPVKTANAPMVANVEDLVDILERMPEL